MSGISTRVREYGQSLYDYYSAPGGPQTGQNGPNQVRDLEQKQFFKRSQIDFLKNETLMLVANLSQ